MKGTISLYLLSILISITCKSQALSINIYVVDSISSEPLIGANLTVDSKNYEANSYGFISFNVDKNYAKQIKVSYVGYNSFDKNLNLTSDTTLILKLVQASNLLNTVSIIAGSNDNFLSKKIGKERIGINEIRSLSHMFSEIDVLKVIQNMSGVQSGSEGSVGLHVRGGSPDQNLILLDNVPVYNVNHLFGFFSVFNPDAVSNVEFYKGYLPSRYSGRVSSALDINLKEGSMTEYKKTVAINPISSRFHIEGPIVKNKSSFIIAGRRTWIDLFTRTFQNTLLPNYNFYDFNAKANFVLNNNNKLFFGYYSGNDKFSFSSNEFDERINYGFDWGNQTLNLRWVKSGKNGTFINITPYFTTYSFKSENKISGIDQDYISSVQSSIYDIGLKSAIQFQKGGFVDEIGAKTVSHTFSPNIQYIQGQDIVVPQVADNKDNFYEIAFYVQKDFELGKLLNVSTSISQSNYLLDNINYHFIEPRIGVNVNLYDKSTVKLGYNYLTQPMHLLVNPTLSLPTDLWVSVTEDIPPVTSHNFSIGFFQEYLKRKFTTSVELYYRSLNNLIEYKDGFSFQSASVIEWEKSVDVGIGSSYGVEFATSYAGESLNLKLNYTFSKTDRMFENINNGMPFPYTYDRPHNANMNALYDINKRSSIACSFVFRTGNAITLPVGTYNLNNSLIIENQYVKDYLNQLNYIPYRNNYRMPNYHRFDLSYRNKKIKRQGYRILSVDIYNAYNRQNAFLLFYKRGQLSQASLFPIIPTLSYEFHF